MKNRVLKSAAVGLITLIAVYLLTAFIFWEFDPQLWGEVTRMELVIMACMVVAEAVWFFNLVTLE